MGKEKERKMVEREKEERVKEVKQRSIFQRAGSAGSMRHAEVTGRGLWPGGMPPNSGRYTEHRLGGAISPR